MNGTMVARMMLLGVLALVPGLRAATVSWQSTTRNNPWVDKGTIETTDWDNDNGSSITVDETTMYQEIDGFGGSFNEVGWKVLMKLSASTRDSVMKLLFHPDSGCNFTLCRVPIGANDYCIERYTYNETRDDYDMNNFSIEHDQQYLIPYMKAAQAINPDLKIWGSPWTVPTWMKTSGQYDNGRVKDDDRTFAALALYFSKTVRAFQEEGIRYFAMMPANEPRWDVSMGYPVTGWAAEQFREFIRNYLGPQFRKDDVNAYIYLGTMLNDEDVAGNTNTTEIVFNDSTAYSYCTGSGYQYQMEPMWRQYPDKRFMETETPCGTVSRFNDENAFWNYAMENDNTMRNFLKVANVNVYEQWNIVLDTSGANIADWRQYAPVMIDTVNRRVTYTPQFYQVRHYCYVKRGAYRIEADGSANVEVIAFRNPDGENVLILTNKGGDATVAINFNGRKIKPTIPGSSFNTFRIAGTPLPPVSPFSEVQAEDFSAQSGVLIRPCSDGGDGLTLIENNDWVVYHNADFEEGAMAFSARVAGAAGGTIEVRIDSCTGPAAGTCTVDASSDWSTVTCPVEGIAGTHELYLKFKGDAPGKLFDLNWFQFEAGTSTKQTSGAAGLPVSPRFSGDGIHLNKVKGLCSVTVSDLQGRAVYRWNNGTASRKDIIIPLGGAARGIYLFALETATGRFSGRVVMP